MCLCVCECGFYTSAGWLLCSHCAENLLIKVVSKMWKNMMSVLLVLIGTVWILRCIVFATVVLVLLSLCCVPCLERWDIFLLHVTGRKIKYFEWRFIQYKVYLYQFELRVRRADISGENERQGLHCIANSVTLRACYITCAIIMT